MYFSWYLWQFWVEQKNSFIYITGYISACVSQYGVCFLCDMTLFTFSCELPLLLKGPFLLTLWICMLLPSCGALHSPLWFSSCCFTEAHRNLLSLWPQPSERFVFVISWGKRLWELQTSFSRACAWEHMFIQTALYRIVSHCYCLHKSCAKTPWLQISVTVLKHQGKSCLKQYMVLSVHPLNNLLSTLHCLLSYSRHTMSTFQINIEIPFDTVNCSSKHGSYCSPSGGWWGGCFCSSLL